MSRDSDTAEDYRLMDELRKQRHAEWKRENLRLLDESGIPFVRRTEETCLFRQHGYPKCDFYPSTGRWRVAGKAGTFSGGAMAFLNWYRRQKQ